MKKFNPDFMKPFRKAKAKDLDYDIFVKLPGSDKVVFVNDVNLSPDKVFLFCEWFDAENKFRCEEYFFSHDFELFYYDPEEKEITLDKIFETEVA